MPISAEEGPLIHEDLAWRSALEIAALVRDKQLSPVELTAALLARIEELNPRLNAYCLVAADLARVMAREAEIAVMKREPLGPLHGVPVSLKDVLYTRGLRTTGGSRLFADLIPEEDAVPVGRLRAAGAVILGKTNTSEFGHKALTDNPLFGPTRNPWDPERTPGGSSGGAAAAVAAGLGPIGLGTDGGGSVRIPAALCGLVGFKPSYGRIPQGVRFPGWDHVGHVGTLTRTVRDAALALDVVAGGDDRDRISLPREPGAYLEACEEDVRGLHVAWTPDLGYAAVDDKVLEVCGNAAAAFEEELGCHVEVVNPGWENPEDAFATIVAAQFYSAWSDALPAREADLDPTLVRFVRRGGAVTAREYLTAMSRVHVYWHEVRLFLERFDLLLTPTTAVPAFPLGAGVPRDIAGHAVSVLGWMPFAYPFNLTGQPAISVPAGFTEEGLPVGLQIVGRRHADRTVLAAAAAFEAACPWSDRHPTL
jgi:aspartyl-tRNA(Asn)/glutamyl-tRNA(Gln) amidotransferase subunit A